MTTNEATRINHGPIPYLCSQKISNYGYCTAKAEFKMNTGSKGIFCNKHYAAEVKVGTVTR